MKDKIEKFIIENKQDFNSEHPGKDVWKNIESSLGWREQVGISILWKAAAVFFFALSSFLLFERQGSSDFPQQIAADQNFGVIEQFYISQINEMKDEIDILLTSDIDVDDSFKEDLGKLDAMYLVLKDNLSQNPTKGVIDALVLNLIMKIDLLNEKLLEIEDVTDDDPYLNRSI